MGSALETIIISMFRLKQKYRDCLPVLFLPQLQLLLLEPTDQLPDQTVICFPWKHIHFPFFVQQ
jgi:hypothetical protein